MSDSGPPDRPPAEPDQRTPVPLPPRYRFGETLGEGGLGTVVKAYDTQLRTHVAIKTIRHDLRQRNREQYEHLRDRFEHEAIAGARVRDSHYVVTVHDLVIDETGDAFLILAFAPGGTLADRLREGPLPLAEALRLTADAARGLRDLHAADLVHRDIKPENIFLAADGRAMIGDLGIVQMSTTTFRTRLAYGSAHGHPGTPLYMSPEQETSTGFLTPESDQYSLGAVLFELLTGQRFKQIYADERETLLASLPGDVAALIRRMTADRAADRYRGMAATAAAMEHVDLTATPLIPASQPETATVPATIRRETPRTGIQPAPPVLATPASPPPLSSPAPRPINRRVVLTGVGAVALGGAAGSVWTLGHRGSGVPVPVRNIPPTGVPASSIGVPLVFSTTTNATPASSATLPQPTPVATATELSSLFVPAATTAPATATATPVRASLSGPSPAPAAPPPVPTATSSTSATVISGGTVYLNPDNDPGAPLVGVTGVGSQVTVTGPAVDGRNGVHFYPVTAVNGWKGYIPEANIKLG